MPLVHRRHRRLRRHAPAAESVSVRFRVPAPVCLIRARGTDPTSVSRAPNTSIPPATSLALGPRPRVLHLEFCHNLPSPPAPGRIRIPAPQSLLPLRHREHRREQQPRECIRHVAAGTNAEPTPSVGHRAHRHAELAMSAPSSVRSPLAFAFGLSMSPLLRQSNAHERPDHDSVPPTRFGRDASS